MIILSVNDTSIAESTMDADIYQLTVLRRGSLALGDTRAVPSQYLTDVFPLFSHVTLQNQSGILIKLFINNSGLKNCMLG